MNDEIKEAMREYREKRFNVRAYKGEEYLFDNTVNLEVTFNGTQHSVWNFSLDEAQKVADVLNDYIQSNIK